MVDVTKNDILIDELKLQLAQAKSQLSHVDSWVHCIANKDTAAGVREELYLVSEECRVFNSGGQAALDALIERRRAAADARCREQARLNP